MTVWLEMSFYKVEVQSFNSFIALVPEIDQRVDDK